MSLSKVGTDVLQAARQDPRYEAQHAIVGYVICRVCGAELRKLERYHLREFHDGMTLEKYREEFPGAPLIWLGRSEERRKLYRARIPKVESEILDLARRNPRYEMERGIRRHVICRDCGAKCSQLASGHLGLHGMSSEKYLRRFPNAPLMCLSVRAKLKSKWSAPGEKERRSTAMKLGNAVPGRKESRSASQKEVGSRKKIRKVRRRNAKRQWATATIRTRMIRSLRETRGTAEAKESQSTYMRGVFQRARASASTDRDPAAGEARRRGPKGRHAKTIERTELVAALLRLGLNPLDHSASVYDDTPKTARVNTSNFCSENREQIEARREALSESQARAILSPVRLTRNS